MFLPGLVKCRLVRLQASSPPNSRPFIGGGGLEIKTAQPVIVADCVFECNSGRQGSGLHLDACPSTLVWNSSFDSNHATYEGGAVALVNSDGQGLFLGNSSLTHNFGKATDSLDLKDFLLDVHMYDASVVERPDVNRMTRYISIVHADSK